MRLSTNPIQHGEVLALAEFAAYCDQHPRSPSAVQKPKILNRGSLWVVLLGPNLELGIAGIGSTVGKALRAFDRQYQNFLESGLSR